MLQKKHKVLNVLTVIEDGGMETLVNNIYEGLSDTNEFEFYVCSLVRSDKTFVFSKLEKLCKDVFVLGIVNKDLKISDYIVLIRKIFKLAKYISDNRFSVVNSHDYFSGAYTRIAIILSKIFFFFSPIRNYVTLHNLFFWLGKKHHLINKILSAGTDKIICVSRSVYEYSSKYDKIKQQKYKIILNGINEKYFLPDMTSRKKYREEFNIKETDFVIGNIGTLSVRKGHIYLVKAIESIIKNYPNIKLLIFGSSRGHEKEVKDEVMSFVKAHQLEKFIYFHDSRKDIKYIYNMFDLYVMSSVSEGLSLAAIEAMLMERICLFSDIGPFKELIVDKENGFLFETQNIDNLSDKLSLIIKLNDNSSKIGENARNTIIQKFNYQKMISEYYSMYKCLN